MARIEPGEKKKSETCKRIQIVLSWARAFTESLAPRRPSAPRARRGAGSRPSRAGARADRRAPSARRAARRQSAPPAPRAPRRSTLSGCGTRRRRSRSDRACGGLPQFHICEYGRTQFVRICRESRIQNIWKQNDSTYMNMSCSQHNNSKYMNMKANSNWNNKRYMCIICTWQFLGFFSLWQFVSCQNCAAIRRFETELRNVFSRCGARSSKASQIDCRRKSVFIYMITNNLISLKDEKSTKLTLDWLFDRRLRRLWIFHFASRQTWLARQNAHQHTHRQSIDCQFWK